MVISRRSGRVGAGYRVQGAGSGGATGIGPAEEPVPCPGYQTVNAVADKPWNNNKAVQQLPSPPKKPKNHKSSIRAQINLVSIYQNYRAVTLIRDSLLRKKLNTLIRLQRNKTKQLLPVTFLNEPDGGIAQVAATIVK